MAISVLSKTEPAPFNGGQQGMYVQFFTYAFSTTDLTGTVPVGLRKVKFRSAFAFLDNASTDEVINYGNTNNTDGTPVLGAGPTLTIDRGAVSPLTGLKFSFFILGYV
jgi:hypothetical protein